MERYEKNIRSYVLRSGKMSPAQKKGYSELKEQFCIPYCQEGQNIVFFDNDNPVILEIGFGMGHATIDIAQKNPDKNYLGIEVHRPGIGRVLWEIRKKEIQNLKLIEQDAVSVLKNMIPENKLEGVHIFFPDPWPKLKHRKRRLIQNSFLDIIIPKIKPGGYIYAVTDWKDYSRQMLETLSTSKGINNKYAQFAPKQIWRPETKFEKKGFQKNHEIFELLFIRDKEN